MKHILLISDTHGFLDPALDKHIEAADEVWHAGDIGDAAIVDKLTAANSFRGVYGNIDGTLIRKLCPEVQLFECESVKVCMIHIGGYPGKYPARIKSLIEREKPALFICGHSHILKVIYDKQFSLLHINPGACGTQGFHQVRTAIRFRIDGKEIKDLAVIELGKRSAGL